MLELLTLISDRQFMLTINSVLIYSEKASTTVSFLIET